MALPDISFLLSKGSELSFEEPSALRSYSTFASAVGNCHNCGHGPGIRR